MFERVLLLLQFFIYRITLRTEKAKKICFDKLEKKHTEPLARILLTNLLSGAGEYAEAIRHYKKLAEKNPADHLNWLNMIKAFYYSKQYEELLIAGEAYMQKNFSYSTNIRHKRIAADIHWYLAQAAVRLRNFGTAASEFESFLNLSKKDREFVYEALGYCYEKLGKLDLAVKNYENALKINYNLKTAKHNLQNLHANIEKDDTLEI